MISMVTLIDAFANPNNIIRYGDYTPKSDLGKLAVAGYALLAVGVMAGILKPSKEYLEKLCRVASATGSAAAVKTPVKLQDNLSKKKED